MNSGDLRTPKDLSGLIRILRQERFQVGASEAIDATTLILAARDHPAISKDVPALKSHLRPVFCKSVDEQERFDGLFDEWWTSVPDVVSPEPDPHIDDPPPTPQSVAGRRWPAVVLAALLLGTLAYAYWSDRGSRVPDEVVTETAPPIQPTTAPPLRPISPPPPAPAVEGRITVDRFVPAVRVNVELKPFWAWLLGGLPLAALLAVSVPYLVISRTKARRRSEPMYLDPGPLMRQARRLVPPMNAEIGDRLARHVRSRGIDIERLARRPSLDLRRTIEATINNFGVPTLRYSIARVHPSYLLLVDVKNERDPRGRLFYQWAERLQREGIQVDLLLIRQFSTADAPPSLCVSPPRDALRGEGKWVPFEQRHPPAFGERLLVVSDGNLFVDADGAWRNEAVRCRFYQWRDRAMFTPVEPRDWGVREVRVERSERPNDPGFIVLPLEESALAAWTDLVLSGQLSNIALDDPQRFPSLLRASNAGLFESDVPPGSQTVERLMQQLHVYLGESGFQWLGALAIAPVIRWELTLILGKAVLARLSRIANDDDQSLDPVLSRNYRRLVRLPWLQRESMPNWLRVRLLSELSQIQQATLRDVVRVALGQLSPTPTPDGIRLDFERPPGEADESVGETDGRQDGDLVYLGYMSGLGPEQLVMRAPAEWSAWAQQLPLRRVSGVGGFLQRARQRTRAAWARWVWADGVPHLGFNVRRAVALLALTLPLAGALVAAKRFAPEAPLIGTDWFFEEREHREVVSTPGVVKVALNTDGTRLAVGYADGTIQFLNPATGLPLTSKRQAHSGPVGALTFARDGELLASGGFDRTLRLWNSDSGLPVRSFAVSLTTMTALTFNAEGDSVIAGSADGGLGTLIMSSDGAAWSQLASEDPATRADLGIVRILFDANGNLVAMRRDGTSLVKLSQTDAIFARSGRDEWPAAYSPDRGRVASAGPGGAVRLWDDKGQMVGAPLTGHSGSIVDLAFSGNSEHLASASADGTVRIWDAHAATITKVVSDPDVGGMWSVAFSPNGQQLATGGERGEIRIWDARSLTPIDTIRHYGHTVGEPLIWVTFSPDGSRIASIGADTADRLDSPTIHLWDIASGRLLTELATGPEFPSERSVRWSVVFSPDGHLLAAADRLVRIWDSETHQEVLSVALDEEGFANQIAFSPDGRELALACSDGRLRIVNVAAGNVVASVRPQPSDGQTDTRKALLTLAYSADGRRIIAGGDDGVSVWDAQTRSRIGQIFPSRTTSLTYAQDNRRLISCGAQFSISDSGTLASIGSPLSDTFCAQVAINPAGNQIAEALPGPPGSGRPFGFRVWRLNDDAPRQEITVPRARRVVDALLTRLTDWLLVVGLAVAAFVLLAFDTGLRGRQVSRLNASPRASQ